MLTGHPLDGVYYDWNVALLCCNPRHEKLKAGQPAAGHWDIDELLNLMEWTRRRVGPRGLVIIHNTTTPMFATENFADDIVANEWGYGKWSGQGPSLQELPLEWSLVGARARGVISYGQLDAKSPRRLHRLFALEALLAGVTPWPATPETFDLFTVLKPIGALETCRFADWRNQAVTIRGARSASAIYSRPGEAWLVLANLDESTKEVSCVLHPDKLPYPLSSVATATLFPPGNTSTNVSDKAAPLPLDAQQLTGGGVSLTIPPDSAVFSTCDDTLTITSGGAPIAAEDSRTPKTQMRAPVRPEREASSGARLSLSFLGLLQLKPPRPLQPAELHHAVQFMERGSAASHRIRSALSCTELLACLPAEWSCQDRGCATRS